MKIKALTLSLVAALAISASAQEVTSTYTSQEPAKDTSFKKNGAGDNWFISVQGGTNIVQGFSSKEVRCGLDFTKCLGISAGLGIGKWHNPYFGTRLMIDYNLIRDPYAKKLQEQHTLNPHFDFLFNVLDYFGVYNPSRVFKITPYIGVGYMGSQIILPTAEGTKVYFDKHNFNHAVSGNLGVDLSVRLGKCVTLDIAPSVAFSNFLHSVAPAAHKSNDLLAQVRAGLTFDLGKNDWEAIEPMDYALLNTLQSEVNALRAQNAELSKRPVRCPDCPEPKTIVEKKPTITSTVNFRIERWKVDRNQMINIYNAAEFAKSNNAPLVVTGYADARTGSPEYNLKISEKRAREVARILTEEYGVPSSLITIDYKGSAEQPYAENAWNRVVIMKGEKQ